MDQPLTTPSRAAEAVPQASARLVYSLLKAALRLAARFEMPLDQVVQLTRLAYYEEQRRQQPDDLKSIARRLRVSLRTVGNLSSHVKNSSEFFAPEHEVEPLRRITTSLAHEPKSYEQLVASSADLEEHDLRRALALLEKVGWVQVEEDGRYAMCVTERSLVADDVLKRVDGINHQMEIISESVWRSFVRNSAGAGARSWAFTAAPARFAAFMEETIRNLRVGLVDLEESALSKRVFDRYAVTVSYTPLENSK